MSCEGTQWRSVIENNDEVQEGLSGKVSLKLRPTEDKALMVRRHVEEHVRPRKQQVTSLQEGGVAQSGPERKGASDGS